MQDDEWRALLEAYFPSRSADEEQLQWAALRASIPAGQDVKGTVVARAPFGAWVDIGYGFPALLQIIFIADLTPYKYQLDDWCPIGSEVTAKPWFNDEARKIRLWQIDPHGFLKN